MAKKAVKKVIKKNARSVSVKNTPLSQGFLLTGILGALVTIWWTYFGLDGKFLPLEWGITLILFFVILIMASFKSLEIS